MPVFERPYLKKNSIPPQRGGKYFVQDNGTYFCYRTLASFLGKTLAAKDDNGHNRALFHHLRFVRKHGLTRVGKSHKGAVELRFKEAPKSSRSYRKGWRLRMPKAVIF
jgi:hypothetical protein